MTFETDALTTAEQGRSGELPSSLSGARVAVIGKLAGMSRRDAQQLIREQGGIAVDDPSESINVVVLGEDEWPLAPVDWDRQFGDATREAVAAGRIEVITETQLWQRLGLIEIEQHVHRLYTPAMLAELLDVPLAVVRRWHRAWLDPAAREVRRLPYFDFQEIATARRLAELLAAGMSPQTIENKLAELARFLPGVQRPLAQLSIIVEGKQLLLRKGDGLIAPGGQFWFDFGPAENLSGENRKRIQTPRQSIRPRLAADLPDCEPAAILGLPGSALAHTPRNGRGNARPGRRLRGSGRFGRGGRDVSGSAGCRRAECGCLFRAGRAALPPGRRRGGPRAIFHDDRAG